MEKDAGSLLDARKEVGLAADGERTEYMSVSNKKN
jgi:hypothetical protein